MGNGKCDIVHRPLAMVIGYQLFEVLTIHAQSEATRYQKTEFERCCILFLIVPSHDTRLRKRRQKMATHQQMLSNAIGTQPVMAEEEHSAVQDNACTVRECHLEQTPVEKKGNVRL